MGLNKDTNYNTNFLTGKKISNISLEYFDENKFYKEDDLKKNNYTLIIFGPHGALRVDRSTRYLSSYLKRKT